MTDTFTLRFALDVEPRRQAQAPLSAHERELAFAREQIAIMLCYVTLYEGGRRIVPDGFAMASSPDDIFPLHPERGR